MFALIAVAKTVACKDMVKFGGKGSRKQCCQLRKCIKLISPTKQQSEKLTMQLEEGPKIQVIEQRKISPY